MGGRLAHAQGWRRTTPQDEKRTRASGACCAWWSWRPGTGLQARVVDGVMRKGGGREEGSWGGGGPGQETTSLGYGGGRGAG